MNKKILVSLSIMIIIVIGLLIVHFSYANLGGETSANDNDDNTLVVGFDAEFPPYGFKDDQGNYIGFDLDLAQEVCNRNNWTLKKQAIAVALSRCLISHVRLFCFSLFIPPTYAPPLHICSVRDTSIGWLGAFTLISCPNFY